MSERSNALTAAESMMESHKDVYEEAWHLYRKKKNLGKSVKLGAWTVRKQQISFLYKVCSWLRARMQKCKKENMWKSSWSSYVRGKCGLGLFVYTRQE